MNKTVKQIADELGIDKQRVYRYIKSHRIVEVHHEADQRHATKYFDDAAQEAIKRGFSEKSASREAHREVHHEALYEALLKQLEEKDRQIEQLQKLLDQEQQLRMITERPGLETIDAAQESENAENTAISVRRWWQFWKRGE